MKNYISEIFGSPLFPGGGTSKVEALNRETLDEAVMEGTLKRGEPTNAHIAAHIGRMAQSAAEIAADLASDAVRHRLDASGIIMARQNRILLDGRQVLIDDLNTAKQKLANAERSAKSVAEEHSRLLTKSNQAFETCLNLVAGSEYVDADNGRDTLFTFEGGDVTLAVLQALHAAGICIRVTKKEAELCTDTLVVEVVLPQPDKSTAPEVK